MSEASGSIHRNYIAMAVCLGGPTSSAWTRASGIVRWKGEAIADLAYPMEVVRVLEEWRLRRFCQCSNFPTISARASLSCQGHKRAINTHECKDEAFEVGVWPGVGTTISVPAGDVFNIHAAHAHQ